MNIETAIAAIEGWYDGMNHVIIGLEEEPPQSALDSNDEFDKCPDEFEGLYGHQSVGGMSGDDFHGRVYFKIPNGKWIDTEYFS